MTIPHPSTEPGQNHSVAIRDWCSEWISSPALHLLLDRFGFQGKSDPTVQEIADFTSRTWDFRSRQAAASVERNQIVDEIDETLATEVEGAATELGLLASAPPRHTDYDHVLVLGGLIRASLLRPNHAAMLINDGVTAGTVAGIGGYRELRGDEIVIRDAAGITDVSNEIEAMDEGLKVAFDLAECAVEEQGHFDGNDLNRSWLVRRYMPEGAPEVILVAAPSTDPSNRRANTGDTYKYWAENLVQLAPKDRVLLVTHTIYAPFQSLDGLRMLSLPYGCGLDVSGVPNSATVPGVPPQDFSASHYLQEINSTIRSIKFSLDQIGASQT